MVKRVPGRIDFWLRIPKFGRKTRVVTVKQSGLYFIGVLVLATTGYWAGVRAGDAHDLPSRGHHAHAAPHGGLVQTVGPNHLELVFDDRSGRFALYSLGRGAADAHPIPAMPLTVLVEPADPGGFSEPFEIELLPIAQEGDPRGFSSRFVGGGAELLTVDNFRATVLTSIAGRAQETTFSIDGSGSRQFMVCPMGCEGKTFSHPGSCPVCKMRLQPTEKAHLDHTPKHGGILFMAPNGWHHLEGVLVSPQEFRLYLYNDFTRPIRATEFADGSWVEISTVGDHAEEPVKANFVPVGGGEYLRALIPDGLSAPLEVELRLQFDGQDEPDLFNFRFEL